MKINTTYLAIGLAFLGLPIALNSVAYLPISITFFVLAFTIPPEEDEEENSQETAKKERLRIKTKREPKGSLFATVHFGFFIFSYSSSSSEE